MVKLLHLLAHGIGLVPDWKNGHVEGAMHRTECTNGSHPWAMIPDFGSLQQNLGDVRPHDALVATALSTPKDQSRPDTHTKLATCATNSIPASSNGKAATTQRKSAVGGRQQRCRMWGV